MKKISDKCYALQVDTGEVFSLSTNDSSYFGISFNNNVQPLSLDKVNIIPYGDDNKLPTRIREILDSNNLAPGIIERQLGLIYGQGLYLYKEKFEDGEIIQEWCYDKNIQEWLDSWDYKAYIRACLSDYLYMRSFFCSIHRTKGARIGKNSKIAYLQHIPITDARLEWVDSQDYKDIKNIIIGNFESNNSEIRYTKLPVYSKADPCAYPISVKYNKSYSFARQFYSLPAFFSTLRWIIKGSEIPAIFKYVTDNGLNLAYHVHSPDGYWNMKRELIRKVKPEISDEKLEKEIAELAKNFLQSLTKVLSGKENAGKFFHTVDITEGGETYTWKIEPIDQKIKDFVDSQLKISEASTSAITSGMGLHPALSNIMVNGKLASGSELLYAFKLFLLADIEIPSSIVLETINEAIAYNFPNSDLKLGFYHTKLKTEEATSSKDRIKNA